MSMPSSGNILIDRVPWFVIAVWRSTWVDMLLCTKADKYCREVNRINTDEVKKVMARMKDMKAVRPDDDGIMGRLLDRMTMESWEGC